VFSFIPFWNGCWNFNKENMKTINAIPDIGQILPERQTGTFEGCHIKWAMDSFINLCEAGLNVPVNKIEQVFDRASCRVHPNNIIKQF